MLLTMRWVLLLLLPGSVAFVRAAPPTPERPPIFAVVKSVEKQNAITLVYWVPEPRPETRAREVEVDGKKQTQVYTVMRLEQIPVEVTVPQSKIPAETLGGRTLKGVAAWRAQVGKAVLILPPGVRLDPAYKAQLTPDTVIVSPGEELPKPTPTSYPPRKESK